MVDDRLAGMARCIFVHGAVRIVTSLTRSVSFLRSFLKEFVGAIIDRPRALNERPYNISCRTNDHLYVI